MTGLRGNKIYQTQLPPVFLLQNSSDNNTCGMGSDPVLLISVLSPFAWCCSQKAKIACKIRDEYQAVKEFKPPQAASKGGLLANGSEAAANGSAAPASKDKSTTAKLIESMPAPADECVHTLTTMSYKGALCDTSRNSFGYMLSLLDKHCYESSECCLLFACQESCLKFALASRQ